MTSQTRVFRLKTRGSKRLLAALVFCLDCSSILCYLNAVYCCRIEPIARREKDQKIQHEAILAVTAEHVECGRGTRRCQRQLREASRELKGGTLNFWTAASSHASPIVTSFIHSGAHAIRPPSPRNFPRSSRACALVGRYPWCATFPLPRRVKFVYLWLRHESPTS
ncbi:hypothetical protein FKP32DRAFT_644062 [Trametes sanguinea]|nr:hypothetical protein FKP32DRAFT_644062 [Trametes sanguinea]